MTGSPDKADRSEPDGGGVSERVRRLLSALNGLFAGIAATLAWTYDTWPLLSLAVWLLGLMVFAQSAYWITEPKKEWDR